jgi:hypothetical protein
VFSNPFVFEKRFEGANVHFLQENAAGFRRFAIFTVKHLCFKVAESCHESLGGPTGLVFDVPCHNTYGRRWGRIREIPARDMFPSSLRGTIAAGFEIKEFAWNYWMA